MGGAGGGSGVRKPGEQAQSAARPLFSDLYPLSWLWQDFGYPFSMPKAYQFIWGYSLLNYCFAVTIYAVAREGLFARVLETRLLRYMGKTSYGLYACHLAIIWFSARIQDVLPVEGLTAKLLNAIVALLISLLVAHLSYSLWKNRY